MRQLIKKIACLLASVVCFVIGILGLFLPIIPGLVFLAISLIFLSMASSRVRQFLDRLRHKYSALDKAWSLAENKIKAKFKK